MWLSILELQNEDSVVESVSTTNGIVTVT